MRPAISSFKNKMTRDFLKKIHERQRKMKVQVVKKSNKSVFASQCKSQCGACVLPTSCAIF